MLLPSGKEGRCFMSQHRVIKTHHFYCHKSTEPLGVADAGRITALWGPQSLGELPRGGSC